MLSGTSMAIHGMLHPISACTDPFCALQQCPTLQAVQLCACQSTRARSRESTQDSAHIQMQMACHHNTRHACCMSSHDAAFCAGSIHLHAMICCLSLRCKQGMPGFVCMHAQDDVQIATSPYRLLYSVKPHACSQLRCVRSVWHVQAPPDVLTKDTNGAAMFSYHRAEGITKDATTEQQAKFAANNVEHKESLGVLVKSTTIRLLAASAGVMDPAPIQWGDSMQSGVTSGSKRKRLYA